MPYRLCQSIPEIIASITSTVIAMAVHLLAVEDATHNPDELRWLLLPLIGSLLAAVGALLLNPAPEQRRYVGGRGIFAVVGGVSVPKLISLIHPTLHTLYLDPTVLFLAGFCIAVIVYVLARPFVERLFARSNDDADQIVQELEDRARIVSGQKTKPADQP